MQPYSATANVS